MGKSGVTIGHVVSYKVQFSTNNGKFRNAALIVLLLMQNEVKGKLWQYGPSPRLKRIFVLAYSNLVTTQLFHKK